MSIESLKYAQHLKGKEKEDITKNVINEFKDAKMPGKDSNYRDVRQYDQRSCPRYLSSLIDGVMKVAGRETSTYDVLIFIHHRKAAAKFEYKDVKASCIVNLLKPEVYKVHGNVSMYHLLEDGDLMVTKGDNISIVTQNKTTFRFNNKAYARASSYVRYTIVINLH